MVERDPYRPVARCPAVVLARQTGNVIDRDLKGHEPPVESIRL